jgi:hypothetical protein
LCLVAFATVAFFGHSVDAWGKEGHQIVAQIAQDRLSSEALKIVNQFTGGEPLEYIAPLPDDYDHTSQGSWSSPEHYVDLPNNTATYTPADCPGLCVVESIQNYTNRLAATQAKPTVCNFDQSEGVEPCALEFLVHYVGDVHQPLHVGYSYDKGGNDDTVNYMGTTTNLHSVWDTYIINTWNSNYQSATKDLEQMISENPSTVQQYLNVMDPNQWADESHYYVMTACYNYTTVNGVGQLDENYYEDNIGIIQWRLIAAGVRLGALLNDLLVGPNATPVIPWAAAKAPVNFKPIFDGRHLAKIN